MSKFQTNRLKQKFSFEGIGIHTGQKTKVTVIPGTWKTTGITFKHLHQPQEVYASFENVVDTTLGTTLSDKNGMSVSTIEHLMATLYSYGIIDGIIEIDGPEVPIMDGSCQAFVDLIEEAGIEHSDETTWIMTIKRPVRVEDGDSFAEFLPSKGFSIDLMIDFDHKVVNYQKFMYTHSLENFKDQLSRARTFGFYKDVEKLQEQGLALGGSLTNTIVVGDTKVLNKEGLRYEDEFVRHKIVDIIGDMALCGYHINGKFNGYKTGHALNNKLLREVFSSTRNFKLTMTNAAGYRAFAEVYTKLRDNK
jgi:UDP-3-O-[3-hydroxymyristoyl] N-acetylglucosamine deacetylase